MHIKRFHTFSAETSEAAVPMSVLAAPKECIGLNFVTKKSKIEETAEITLYDFDDKKVLGCIRLARETDTQPFQVMTSVAEHGYGPDVYDLAMMCVYPAWVKPSTTIKPKALNVWKHYVTRNDVEKRPIPKNSPIHVRSYDQDAYHKSKNDKESLKVINTEFRMKPSKEHKKLIEAWDKLSDEFSADRRKIRSKASTMFWKMYF